MRSGTIRLLPAVGATVEGGTLTVATTLRPTGDRRVPVSFGWHPYLRLPRSPRPAWRLRLPAAASPGSVSPPWS